MLFRIGLICLLLFLTGVGGLYLLFYTNYVTADRVERVIKGAFVALGGALLAIALFSIISNLDHLFKLLYPLKGSSNEKTVLSDGAGRHPHADWLLRPDRIRQCRAAHRFQRHGQFQSRAGRSLHGAHEPC